MFLPAEYQYFEPLVVATIVVFVVGLIGNVLSFSNRFGNALVTAIVFAAIFGGLAYLSKGEAPAAPRTSCPPNMRGSRSCLSHPAWCSSSISSAMCCRSRAAS